MRVRLFNYSLRLGTKFSGDVRLTKGESPDFSLLPLEASSGEGSDENLELRANPEKAPRRGLDPGLEPSRGQSLLGVGTRRGRGSTVLPFVLFVNRTRLVTAVGFEIVCWDDSDPIRSREASSRFLRSPNYPQRPFVFRCRSILKFIVIGRE